MKKIFALTLTALTICRPAIAQSFYHTTDAPNDAYTASSNSYEIYQVGYQTIGNKVRLTIDTDVPLAGHKEYGALDNHVGHTDIYLTTNKGSFGLKFAPNENPAEIGLYSNPQRTSVARSNFGRGEGLTKLSGGTLVTNDVQVYEFAGEGHKGSNRIVIEFPYSAIANEGDLMVHLTLECGNDIAELFIPSPEINLEIPELETPITVSKPDISKSDTEEQKFNKAWLLTIPLVTLIALALLGGGDDNTPPTTEVKSIYEETPPETKDVPESSTVIALLLILLLVTFKWK